MFLLESANVNTIVWLCKYRVWDTVKTKESDTISNVWWIHLVMSLQALRGSLNLPAGRQPAALPGQWALWLQPSSFEECASLYNSSISFLRGLLGPFFSTLYSYFQSDPALTFTSVQQSQLRTSCWLRSRLWTSFKSPFRYLLFYCTEVNACMAPRAGQLPDCNQT